MPVLGNVHPIKIENFVIFRDVNRGIDMRAGKRGEGRGGVIASESVGRRSRAKEWSCVLYMIPDYIKQFDK